MQVQYVYDENGKKTSVIVPIALWDKVSGKTRPGKTGDIFEPSRFRGIYRNLALDLGQELLNLRQEWERT